MSRKRRIERFEAEAEKASGEYDPSLSWRIAMLLYKEVEN